MNRGYIAFGLSFLAILSIAHAQDLTNEWKAFKQEHKKQYVSEKEEEYRRLVWETNVKLIQQHNTEADRGEHTYWLKVNKYADMTDDEFDQTMNWVLTNVDLPPEPKVDSHEETREKRPSTENGFRTPVKDLTNQWKAFKKEYNKQYSNKKEEEYRRNVWEKNVRMIQQHNAEADKGEHSYRLKVNKYTDMTDDEFNNSMNGLLTNVNLPPKVKVNSHEKKRNKRPRRETGFRTPVKDLTNQWKAFMKENNRLYSNKKEEAYRRKIWEKNVRMIQKHNAEADKGKQTYWMNVNKYADMTDDEFDDTMLRTNVVLPPEPEMNSYEKTREKRPRTGKGFLTPVKDLTNQWKAFKKEHNKHYSNKKENDYRRKVWEKNLRLIQKHNAEAEKGKQTYWMNVNKYADMTDDEFDNTMNGLRTNVILPPEPEVNSIEKKRRRKLPKGFDWRKKGFRTPVKDQGNCASCYAFASIGALEGQYFKKTGTLVSLSEQNIVDCTDNDKYMNYGCAGGFIDSAYRYIKDKCGVDAEQAYPYVGKVDPCRFNKTVEESAIRKFRKIKPSGNVSKLRKVVATHGPVAVSIDARGKTWRHYGHGVYNNPDCTQTNLTHGMVVVGYGKLKKKKYWILKNSRGTTWGMDGYMYMARGKNNTCGIASSAFYPIV